MNNFNPEKEIENQIKTVIYCETLNPEKEDSVEVKDVKKVRGELVASEGHVWGKTWIMLPLKFTLPSFGERKSTGAWSAFL
mgnify:CR=1 FL=1